jgi:hypothetical protein
MVGVESLIFDGDHRLPHFLRWRCTDTDAMMLTENCVNTLLGVAHGGQRGEVSSASYQEKQRSDHKRQQGGANQPSYAWMSR